MAEPASEPITGVGRRKVPMSPPIAAPKGLTVATPVALPTLIAVTPHLLALLLPSVGPPHRVLT